VIVTAMCGPHGVLGCEECGTPVVVTDRRGAPTRPDDPEDVRARIHELVDADPALHVAYELGCTDERRLIAVDEQDFEASIRRDERAKVDAEWRRRVREHLCLPALAALRCIPDGEIRSGCVVHDGAAVRERLRLGYLALTREPAERDSAAPGVSGVTRPTPEPFPAPHAHGAYAERASASEPGGYEPFVAGSGERDVIDLGVLPLPASFQAQADREVSGG
jgi:hypothetical protein